MKRPAFKIGSGLPGMATDDFVFATACGSAESDVQGGNSKQYGVGTM